MFSKQTYADRRKQLRKLVKSGIIILFGNNESPANFPANAYYPFRQDSSFLYYFGQQREGLVGIIDIDNDKEVLVGDDIDIEDIVWYGSVDSIHDMANWRGKHRPYEGFENHLQRCFACAKAHTLPASLPC